jgi:catechol 2,3-dioxygenase-like lactoylglutathione lyase family enzyme
MIEGISAITLATHEMPRAVRFYRALGFEVLDGGGESSFTSFSSRDELSQSHRPACRAALVLVGADNLLRCRC